MVAFITDAASQSDIETAPGKRRHEGLCYGSRRKLVVAPLVEVGQHLGSFHVAFGQQNGTDCCDGRAADESIHVTENITQNSKDR